MTSPGGIGRSLATQVYFKDRVPKRYETYVQTRGSQFASVRAVGAGGGLENGGRIVTFNIKMELN